MKKYIKDAYKTASQHGFHDEEQSVEHFICMIISELMEVVDADRKDKQANIELFEKKINEPVTKYETLPPKERWIYWFNLYVKDTFADALADACIRIFDLAGYKNIDLDRKISIYIDRSFNTEIAHNFTVTEYIYKVCKYLVGYEGVLTLNMRLNYSLSLIFALANKYNIDLEKHIQLKMEYNSSRPYKHGKKY